MVLVASLLFQQVAVAAFACPGPQPPHVEAATAHCAAMAAEQPASPQPLCDPASSSVPMPALEPLVFAPLRLQVMSRQAHRLERSLVQSQAPPRLQYCRLLI